MLDHKKELTAGELSGFNNTVEGAFRSADTVMIVTIESQCFGCGCWVLGHGRTVADARREYRRTARGWSGIQFFPDAHDRAHCPACTKKVLRD